MLDWLLLIARWAGALFLVAFGLGLPLTSLRSKEGLTWWIMILGITGVFCSVAAWLITLHSFWLWPVAVRVVQGVVALLMLTGYFQSVAASLRKFGNQVSWFRLAAVTLIFLGLTAFVITLQPRWLLVTGVGAVLAIAALFTLSRTASPELENARTETKVPVPDGKLSEETERFLDVVFAGKEMFLGRPLTEEEMQATRATFARGEAEAPALAAARAQEESVEREAQEKLDAEMSTPPPQVRCISLNLTDERALTGANGASLLLPAGVSKLWVKCRLEEEDADGDDTHVSITAEMWTEGSARLCGKLDPCALVDLTELKGAEWWREKSADWQEDFNSGVLLDGLNGVEDARAQVEFPVGKATASFYAKYVGYKATLSVPGDGSMIWVRVHSLNYWDEEADSDRDLAPFCFALDAVCLLDGWYIAEEA